MHQTVLQCRQIEVRREFTVSVITTSKSAAEDLFFTYRAEYLSEYQYLEAYA